MHLSHTNNIPPCFSGSPTTNTYDYATQYYLHKMPRACVYLRIFFPMSGTVTGGHGDWLSAGSLSLRSDGLDSPRSMRLSSSAIPTPCVDTVWPSSTSGPSSSSSSPGSTSAPFPAPRRIRLAWNVRLAVAFENKGNRYRSSIAWNHFESSLRSAGPPTAGEEPSGPAPLPPGTLDVGASGSTSPPSDSSESLDAAENTDPVRNGENGR